MRFLAVLSVRNEGAFLLEWLAHHRAAGFTDFLVLSNDCEDGTDAMLDRLQQIGELIHLPNPAPHEGGVQFAGLKRADKHPLTSSADWIMALDIDEFVNIHCGGHRLADLLAALPDATAITLTWRLFGNAGEALYVDELVTDQFTRAAPAVMHWPWRAAMFKTLYRHDRTYRKLGVHRPKSPDPDRVEDARWFDAAGRELPDRFRRQQIFSPFGRDNFRLAQLNHYPLQSMQSYILKCDRGRAVHSAERLGMDYWVERNWSDQEDSTISALRPARDTELVRLRGDDELARLHEKAVAWRQTRFESLMKEEHYRALFGRLLMTPPSRALSPERARFMFRYAQSSPEPRN